MMRTPITYYGGKQRLAPDIIAMMPKHKIYCEPFFGGGAVFFRKPKAGIEVINDHDGQLINFYWCVQNKFDELSEMVRQTLHSEAMYKYAKDVWNERVIMASDVEKAWAVWLITNGSFAGSMQGGWKWCNGSSGGHTGTFIKGKRSDFSERLHQRLDDVQISCRDALKVIDDRDTPDTFFYLDPPYPNCYQGHYGGYTEEDLQKLLVKLCDLKGKFILSNYWCDILRMYVKELGWNYKEVELSMRLTNLGRGCRPERGIQQRTEVLVYNYSIEPSLF
jgi:DNA adenine methylase